MNGDLLNGQISMSKAAFDVQGLNNLRREAVNRSPAGIKKIAHEFESVFIQMMMKSMRAAVPQGGLLNSHQTELYTSLFDQQIAQQSSGKGFGLADMLMKQMAPQNAAAVPQGDMQAGAVTAQALNEQFGLTPFTPKPLPQSLTPAALAQVLKRSAAAQVNAESVAKPPESSRDFIGKLMLPAKNAAEKSGIAHHLILAQAALESGWGRREIQTENGQPSYNLFGIKASSNWSGKTTNITTTEYVNGQPQKMKQVFKVYDSYEHALNDYVALLTQHDRYSPVVNAKTPEQGAVELQKAGYATDPKYANKLINLIQQIKQVGESVAYSAPKLDALFRFNEIF